VTRRHRGPAPKDRELFAAEQLPALWAAAEELSWLLSRGYPEAASLKLVGDRHALTARQRKAVERAACTDAERADRGARRVRVADLAGRPVALDGFNTLILCESVLSGAPVFVGRDGAHRDLASVHGTWRRVEETSRAVEALAALVAPAASVRWLLDRPVSNSGRLRALLEETAAERGLPWRVELHAHPDDLLATTSDAVATADAWVLDRCGPWTDLPGALAATTPEAWVVDLR